MESEEDLAARLTERLPIEEAEECLCQLEEHCITVGVLGEADAQDLADELGFTERQCDAVLLDDEAWQARYGQGQAGAPGVQQAIEKAGCRPTCAPGGAGKGRRLT